MNVQANLIINSETKVNSGIKFSDAEFLESAFNKIYKETQGIITEGPTIEIELGSIDSGLKINSISTTYSFAQGVSVSSLLSQVQKSESINNLYNDNKTDGNNQNNNQTNVTITIKPEENNLSKLDSEDNVVTNLDLAPSKVVYEGVTGDVFDKSKPKPTKDEVIKMIDEIAPKYGLDPSLVKAIVQTESSFNNQCISHKGAVGLMQLMPVTAREMGLVVNETTDERWDPKKNIEAGIKYIAKYHKIISNHFGKEDWGLTLAGYNAGPNRIMREGKIPNSVKSYVNKINKYWNEYK